MPFRTNKGEEKYNKSKSHFHKNYNERIYYNYDNVDQNKSEIYEKKLNEIVKNALSPKYMEIGNEYMEKDENSLNEFMKDEKNGSIQSKFLEKLRGSTVKVNLNISNNYYNSNYNIINEKKQNFNEEHKDFKEDPRENQEMEQTIGNRLTVFIKKIFYGKDSNRNEQIEKISANNNHKKTNSFKTKSNNEELLYIPCQNCNTLVKIEEIDSHSNVCVKVKLEVYQSEIENINDAINYKLNKLQENLIKIKSNPNFDSNKESYYVHALIQTIADCIKIDKSSEENLEKVKKLLLNLETLIFKFRGTVATQVLLERAKIIFKEKIRAYTKELKSNLNETVVKERLTELKRIKEEKVHETRRLTVQKELLQNKLKNLKQETKKTRQGTNLKPRNFQFLRTHLADEKNENVGDYQQRNSGWSKIPYDFRHVIEDINSDVENTSQTSFNTVQSSVLPNAKIDPDTTLNLTVDMNDHETNQPRKSLVGKPDAKDVKNVYREFVKLVLKVKFEVFNSNHPGQKISERILFNECTSKGIPQNKFREFIVQELNQPEKYLKCFKSAAINRKTNFNAKPMEIINEESF